MSLPVPACAASRMTYACAEAGPAAVSATAEAAETARVLRMRLTGRVLSARRPQGGHPSLLLSRRALRREHTLVQVLLRVCTSCTVGRPERLVKKTSTARTDRVQSPPWRATPSSGSAS